MVNIENLKIAHVQFISWLKTQRENYEIEKYISYVENKLQVYDQYAEKNDVELLATEVPRGICRYLDEFSIDLDFSQTAQTHFDKMSEEVNKLRKQIE